jgi:hypothetical protein
MKEIKKVIVLLLCLPLLLAMPVKAESENLDVNTKGSITISIPEELQEKDVSFSLYYIAGIVRESGEYVYEPAQAFSSGFRISEDTLETESFRAYVADYIEKNDVLPTTTSGLISGKESFSFQDLSVGVYYVAETQLEKDGSYEMSPFVVSVPLLNDGVYVYDVNASSKYQFNKIVQNDPKEPSVSPALPQTQLTTTQQTTTTQQQAKTPSKPTIPFSGTYMYLFPIFCAAGLFLLVVGVYLCFHHPKEV